MSLPSIADLLPHRPPMLWLDQVVAHAGDDIHCRLTIRESQVFVEQGEVEPIVAIEWMAQSVGALVGMFDRARAENPRPGFLIAIPEAEFFVDCFALGDTVDVHAKRAWGDSTLGSFECRCELRGALAATAQISVYRRAMHELGMS